MLSQSAYSCLRLVLYINIISAIASYILVPFFYPQDVFVDGTVDTKIFMELRQPLRTIADYPQLGNELLSEIDTVAAAFFSSAAGC